MAMHYKISWNNGTVGHCLQTDYDLACAELEQRAKSLMMAGKLLDTRLQVVAEAVYSDGSYVVAKSPGLHFYPGDRIAAKGHGPGTIIAKEVVRDTGLNGRGALRHTGRVGIEFDTHTLTAKPAYFWPEELERL